MSKHDTILHYPNLAVVESKFTIGFDIDAFNKRNAISQPETKLSKLLKLMAANEWPKALALAAKFHDLGAHKKEITQGHAAVVNPAFYRQIKQDPEKLIDAGIKALKERYE